MMIRIVLAGLVIVVAGLAATYWFVCPCEQIPGGALSGETAVQHPADWSFTNDAARVPLCQIEVDFPITRSMNVNCMSVDSQLYVSCSGCADKVWAARAADFPAGRVRVAGNIYPVIYRRETSDINLDQIWSTRANKLGQQPSPRPDHWWSFHLAAPDPG